jgi:hypothetical protein
MWCFVEGRKEDVGGRGEEEAHKHGEGAFDNMRHK